MHKYLSAFINDSLHSRDAMRGTDQQKKLALRRAGR